MRSEWLVPDWYQVQHLRGVVPPCLTREKENQRIPLPYSHKTKENRKQVHSKPAIIVYGLLLVEIQNLTGGLHPCVSLVMRTLESLCFTEDVVVSPRVLKATACVLQYHRFSKY